MHIKLFTKGDVLDFGWWGVVWNEVGWYSPTSAIFSLLRAFCRSGNLAGEVSSKQLVFNPHYAVVELSMVTSQNRVWLKIQQNVIFLQRYAKKEQLHVSALWFSLCPLWYLRWPVASLCVKYIVQIPWSHLQAVGNTMVDYWGKLRHKPMSC